MKWTLLVIGTLSLGTQAFGFGTGISDIRAKTKATSLDQNCPDAETLLLMDYNSTALDSACRRDGASRKAEIDGDAVPMAVYTVDDCDHALNVVDEENCFVEETYSFNEEGLYVKTGHRFGHRNSSANAYTVIASNVKRAIRGILNNYCGSSGASSWLFAQVSNDPRLCGANFCAGAFGSGNNCRTACDGQVTANCGGGGGGGACDLTNVTQCSFDCSTLANADGCDQECEAVKVGLGCLL